MNDDGSENEFLGGMGGLQTMGILNALRTGDPFLDMILAMSFPFVIRLLLEAAQRLQNYVIRYMSMRSLATGKVHERCILLSTTRDRYGYVNRDQADSQNSILIKAIELYLHAIVQLTLQEATLDLTSTEDKNASVGSQSYYSYYDYDDNNDDDDSKTVVGALSKYRIVQKLVPGQWHELGNYGKLDPASVRLIIERAEEDKGEKDSSQTKVVNCFRFHSESGEAIDEFINKAYNWYVDELRKLEDNSRYLYELKQSTISRGGSDDDNGNDGSGGSVYTRYKLSDEKTFNSLFFRQKESLLKLIHHFQARSGKYAIEGYPHKLGILLHGPPGSGKTSLIKALAQYTGRSIINVPLARVSTNAELMSIFFEQKRIVLGEHIPVKLGFKDVIFVMEDVDAASKIVKHRDGKTTSNVIRPDQLDLPLPKPLWRMLLESHEEDCKELVKVLLEKSDELKLEANRPETITAVARSATALPGLSLVGNMNDNPVLEHIGREALQNASKMMENQDTTNRFLARHARVLLTMIENGTEVDQSLVDELLGKTALRQHWIDPLTRDASRVSNGDTDEASPLAGMVERTKEDGKVDGFVGPKLLWNKVGRDELNLTGLLNVLDGVVDSPKRIVIMTTNHVDLLDPALIRPGRMDKKLFLGFMSAPDIIAMLEHYFQLSLDERQKSRIEEATAVRGANLTPAQVEQLTAEYDDIEEMIKALEAKGITSS